MLKLFLLAAVGVLSVRAGGSQAERHIKDRIDTFNVLANCWGKEGMIQFHVALEKACRYCAEIEVPMNNGLLKPFDNSSPFTTLPGSNTDQINALRVVLSNPNLASLLLQSSQGQQSLFGRRKRQAAEARGLLNPSYEDELEFTENVMDFKEGMKTKIGNASCVMTQLKMLDSAGNINIRQYTDVIWQYLQTDAAADPAFRQKMTNGFKDCYEIAQSWPQQSLDRNPIFQKYGKHMIFFECAKKVEHKMCYMYQAKQWLEVMYGPMDPTKYGLPEDKYDAAAMALMVKYESATPEMKFVDEIMFGKSKF